MGLFEFLAERLFPYDPSGAICPPTISGVGQVQELDNRKGLTFIEKSGQYFKEKIEVVGQNEIPVWEQVDKKMNFSKRSTDISSFDRQELKKRGLDILRANVLKGHWSRDVTREEAAGVINKYGYSASTIGKYYAAFSSALSREERG